jgi:hypothetical protein
MYGYQVKEPEHIFDFDKPTYPFNHTRFTPVRFQERDTLLHGSVPFSSLFDQFSSPAQQ